MDKLASELSEKWLEHRTFHGAWDCVSKYVAHLIKVESLKARIEELDILRIETEKQVIEDYCEHKIKLLTAELDKLLKENENVPR